MSVPNYPEPRDCSSHGLLGRLYAQSLERERRLLFGSEARLQLRALTPTGETLIAELRTAWSATPIVTKETNNEEWALEILQAANLEWARIRSGGLVVIVAHEDTKRFKIIQVEQDLSVGHVWRLTLTPTGER